MPDITDVERIRWQMQSAAVLGRFLELAARENLPAIAWTVGAHGSVLAGECLSLPHSARGEDFRAWRTAITDIAGNPQADREVTFPDGHTRLLTSWQQVSVRAAEPYPAVQVTLTASIWPDEEG